MRLRTLLLLPLCLLLLEASGQAYDPLHPPNTYRNADNPNYWRNRPPYEDYWQQDVHYRIKARLDDEQDMVAGEMNLVYHNNSPDTLRQVFFHLYQEAYVKGSHLEAKMKAQGYDLSAYDAMPYAGTTLQGLQVDGVELAREQDNTVVRAELPEPLAPGERTTFQVRFTTHWAAGLPRRMKLFNAWGHKHYDGVHWYPRMAVYDRRMGWDTQQHLGNEFYGDFGTFDVELDLPADYVVEATGWLQNPLDVMPDTLRAVLDMKQFADKAWNSPPSVIVPHDPAVRKVWRYHAENVHDFAFTADPTYRIGEAQWNGVRVVALVQEPHASGWQNAAQYTARVIGTYSQDIGAYAYPKMVVADARDGMEYPMLTLDGGRDPDYRGLLAHEVGHNWFFGMVGNNETYRAFLDEGFTQFLTCWALEHIDGDTLVEEEPDNSYVWRYRKPSLVRESEAYNSYQRDAVRNRLPPINVHSDDFDRYEVDSYGYGQVYSKTAVMLYNLQYVLGDSLFLHALRSYFDRWRFCHPYPEDMRESFTRAAGRDLTWFFDAWIDTDQRIDYAVKRVRGRVNDAGQSITLRRKEGMQMPIDLRITARDGRTYDYHIPNQWAVKRTDATVLPRWTGFGDLNREHTITVDIPTGIEDVEIDPSGRLADCYPLDNAMRPPVEMTFDHHVPDAPDRRRYEGFVRPDLWWNGYDGLKIGLHMHGSYMRVKHKVHVSAWLNSGLAQHLPEGGIDNRYDPISFNAWYENATERLLKGSSVRVMARHLDGLQMYGGSVRWEDREHRLFAQVGLRYFVRRDSTDLTYLLYPAEWSLDTWNGILDVTVGRKYGVGPLDGMVELRLRQPAVGTQAPGEHIRLTTRNLVELGGLQLRARGMVQYGTGANSVETSLYLAGASPEEMMENKFVRSIGLIPYDWAGSYGAGLGQFQQGGGLGLRGYAGYVAPELDANGNLVYTYRGNTGAAVNVELDLDGLVKWRPSLLRRYVHLDAYLFGDIGSMGYRTMADDGTVRLRMAPVRSDAGFGLAFTIKRWGPLTDLEPFTIRFDIPLVLSNLPVSENDHVAFRYVVGIGRSF